MTPKQAVFKIEENKNLDQALLTKIKKSGFSRIPVYREKEDNILGVLNVKSLINLEKGRKVFDIYDRNKILEISEYDKLDKILNLFIKRKVHIGFVVNNHKTFLGILTLEDIMEEIISQEIVDETDNFVNYKK